MEDGLEPRGISWVYAAILILAVISVVAVFVIKVPHEVRTQIEVPIPYEVQVPYIIKEPYTEMEEYTVQTPYEVQEQVTYLRRGTYHGNCSGYVGYCIDVTLENTDSEGGNFILNCEFETVSRTFTDTASTYITAGGTRTLECKTNIGAFTSMEPIHYIIAPNKTVTKYRTLTKEREVTKYKPITKYRTNTTYRNETRIGKITQYRSLFGEILDFLF